MAGFGGTASASELHVLTGEDAVSCKDTRFCDGNAFGFDGPGGFAEFLVECEPGMYWLFICYCSGDSRPLKVDIDGKFQEDVSTCSEVTPGGFAPPLEWFRYGPVEVLDGNRQHRLKLYTEGFWPHMGKLSLVPFEQGLERGETIGRLIEQANKPSYANWVVKPSKPMRLDLVDNVRVFCDKHGLQPANPGFIPDPNFYHSVNLDGLWIMSSKACGREALDNAVKLVKSYVPLKLRQLCLKWMAPLGRPIGPMRLVILDNVTNEQAGDCPDMPDDWKGRNGTSNPVCFTSKEDLVGGQRGELTSHELVHALDMVIRQQLDPYFMQEVDDLYRNAIEKNIYNKCYAAADRHEYLAEVTTLFTNTHPGNFLRGCCQCEASPTGICSFPGHQGKPPGPGAVHFTKKSDLIANDPDAYIFLKKHFTEPAGDAHWMTVSST
mmetsp:Transcript_7014/g.11133  ORF Transcript_7014/g.11133 Transcript_7014/m.11133 type:complete len:436 (+) Transcript_7014:35-1342(+)